MLVVLSIYFTALSSTALNAKVSPEEAAKLGVTGTELTPTGAIRAGNKDNSIPPWTGGLPHKPVPAGEWPPNPFPNDKPLFSITASNYKQYADKLSPGQQQMFVLYPDYRMDIYPSRRSARYHPYVYEAALENAVNAELTASGNDFRGAKIAWAFPIPKNGAEAVLNHATKIEPHGVLRWSNTTVVTASGDFQTTKITEEILWNWSKKGNIADNQSGDQDVFYFLQTVRSPAKKAGSVILAHGVMHNDTDKRRVWSYNPGQRRVRRAPQVQYDNPKTGGDGLATSDQLGMYNGNIDRYRWTLVGRKEMYIPYNSNKLHSGDISVEEIIQKGYINRDLTRYELHRVWQVEGDLREGTSHIYKKRVFYMDEDSWHIAVMDHYDKRDQLWRTSEGHLYANTNNLLVSNTAEVHYDLQSGRYLVVGLDNEDAPEDYTYSADSSRFTPAALRISGIR